MRAGTASFTLQPCKVWQDRFVPTKGEGPVDFDWPSLCSKLAPKQSVRGLRTLTLLRKGAFVGLVQSRLGPANFLFAPNGQSNSFKYLLRKDPRFGDRVIEVYRVVNVDWGASLEELGMVRRD